MSNILKNYKIYEACLFASGSCALLFKIGCVQRCTSLGAHKALRRGDNYDRDDDNDDDKDDDDKNYDDKNDDNEVCVQLGISHSQGTERR